MCKQLKLQVKNDKADWLDKAIASGDWHAINSMRQKPKSQHLAIDALNSAVDDDPRAETLAQYYESIQWAVRPTTVLSRSSNMSHTIDVNCEQISFAELRAAVVFMKRNKQCGADGIPAEFLQAICVPAPQASDWILTLFQSIWSRKRVPDEWHLAKIAAIFKKGDPCNCSNSRPISLFSSSYKLFAF